MPIRKRTISCSTYAEIYTLMPLDKPINTRSTRSYRGGTIASWRVKLAIFCTSANFLSLTLLIAVSHLRSDSHLLGSPNASIALRLLADAAHHAHGQPVAHRNDRIQTTD